MLFLIDYERKHGRIVELQRFGDDQRREADMARLERELSISHDPIKREIVIIEAENEEALRRSHSRYFSDPSTLARAIMTSTSAPGGAVSVEF